MKAVQYSGVLWALVVGLTGWANGAAARDIPQMVYACHVTTSTAFPAVVLVQVNTIEEAKEVAQRSQAITFDGTQAQTAQVVECILPATEKFSDASFQQGYDNMAR